MLPCQLQPIIWRQSASTGNLDSWVNHLEYMFLVDDCSFIHSMIFDNWKLTIDIELRDTIWTRAIGLIWNIFQPHA